MAISGLSIDSIIDRRNLKRKITFWRVASLFIAAVAVYAILAAVGAFDGLGKKKADHIARVSISGVITNDRPTLEMFEKLQEDDAVKAVILDISSPGGSTVGGEAIYEAVRTLSSKKPVVTTVGTLAASAGYMIASASDHIVARRSSIVGSIGVIFQYGEVSGLLDKVGVSMNEIKSAPLKAEPSPFHPASEEAKAMINKLVQDSYQWFVGIVAERRKFTELKAKSLADGSIFTGSQGLANGLIDEIGDEATAKKWLVSQKKIDAELEILDWRPERKNAGLFNNPAAGAASSAGVLGWLMQQLGFAPELAVSSQIREILPERLFLDGLISMMQSNAGRKDQK